MKNKIQLKKEIFIILFSVENRQDSGHCCDMGSILGMGTFTHCRYDKKKKKDNVYFVLLGHAQVIFFMKLISVFFPKLRGFMEKWKNKNQEASWVYKLFIYLLSYAEWKRKAWRVNKRIGNEFYPCLGNLTGKAGRSWQPLLSRSQHREPSRS